MATEALKALSAIPHIPVGILLCEYIKPYTTLATRVAELLSPYAGVPLLLCEEEIRAGGFGMMLKDALGKLANPPTQVIEILAVDDSFVHQYTSEPIRRTAGVDAQAIAEKIQSMLHLQS